MLSPFEDLSLSFSDMFTVTIFKGAALFVGVCFIGVFFFALFCFALHLQKCFVCLLYVMKMLAPSKFSQEDNAAGWNEGKSRHPRGK